MRQDRESSDETMDSGDNGAQPVRATEAREIELCLKVILGLRDEVVVREGRFPNLINNRFVSDAVARAIVDYGVSWSARQLDIDLALNAAGRDAMVRKVFGESFPAPDDDTPPSKAAWTLREAVNGLLRQDIATFSQPQVHHFGCWLVRDQKLRVALGPVQVVPRDDWLDTLEGEGTITPLIAQRVRKTWAGERPRKRKPGLSLARERIVLDAVHECPHVCSVTVTNMAAGLGQDKALLVARLALVSISMLWDRPSQIMKGFGLQVDGTADRAIWMTTRPGTGVIGSHVSRQRYPGATWSEHDVQAMWDEAEWLRAPVTRMLEAFIGGQLSDKGSTIDRALFLALWWMQEAVHADTALMATVKFGAALDALAGGKGSAYAIEAMLATRLPLSRKGAITERGQTLTQIVERIYKTGRSRTLHGTNDRFGHDWSETRGLAERLARDALAATLVWSHEEGADSLPKYS